MIGKSTVEWSVPLNMARAGATATPRPRGRERAAHRNLTVALFPAFLLVTAAQRVVHLGAHSTGQRHSIVHEAWSNASTASTFAFLG